MKQVELYGRVRYAVKIQGMSRREAARLFGIDQLDRRMIGPLKRFFERMYEDEATMRVVEGERDQTFDSASISRAFERVKHTEIEEDEVSIGGVLIGLQPIRRTFEFRSSETDEIIEGKFGPQLSQDFLERIEGDQLLLGREWTAKMLKKTVTNYDGRSKTRWVLLQFEE